MQGMATAGKVSKASWTLAKLNASIQVYSIEGSPLCLTGTAEVPLGGLYMDKIIPEDQLPIKLAGFGHCFRTEAGAAGAPD